MKVVIVQNFNGQLNQFFFFLLLFVFCTNKKLLQFNLIYFLALHVFVICKIKIMERKKKQREESILTSQIRTLESGNLVYKTSRVVGIISILFVRYLFGNIEVIYIIFFFNFRSTSGCNGIFSRRLDFSTFNMLPRTRLNSYQIKVSLFQFLIEHSFYILQKESITRNFFFLMLLT